MVDERLCEIKDCLYRVAARVLIVRDGKILLTQEKNGRYAFPGGGVDHGDNFSQTIIRELFEEIGVKISADQISEQPAIARIGQVIDAIPRIHLYFRVEIGDAEPVAKELPFIWIDIDKLDTIEFVADGDELRDFLRKLIKEIS